MGTGVARPGCRKLEPGRAPWPGEGRKGRKGSAGKGREGRGQQGGEGREGGEQPTCGRCPGQAEAARADERGRGRAGRSRNRAPGGHREPRHEGPGRGSHPQLPQPEQPEVTQSAGDRKGPTFPCGQCWNRDGQCKAQDPGVRRDSGVWIDASEPQEYRSQGNKTLKVFFCSRKHGTC